MQKSNNNGWKPYCVMIYYVNINIYYDKKYDNVEEVMVCWKWYQMNEVYGENYNMY